MSRKQPSAAECERRCALMAEALQIKPRTFSELEALTGFSHGPIRKYLNQHAHVGGYISPRGTPQAVWHWGPGDDAEPPPNSRINLNRMRAVAKKTGEIVLPKVLIDDMPMTDFWVKGGRKPYQAMAALVRLPSKVVVAKDA